MATALCDRNFVIITIVIMIEDLAGFSLSRRNNSWMSRIAGMRYKLYYMEDHLVDFAHMMALRKGYEKELKVNYNYFPGQLHDALWKFAILSSAIIMTDVCRM